MTHTLHREGSLEELSKDYVVIAMPAAGVNTEGSGQKLKRFLQIAKKYNPINTGDSKAGNQLSFGTIDKLSEAVFDAGICHAVFDNPTNLTHFLNEVKSENMGISITVSGLFDEIGKCCKEIGATPHTINMSVGIYGQVEKLPPDEIREVTTMCGHSMVTAKMVTDAVEKIRKGGDPVKLATKMAEPCICGVFNITRAARLLKRMADADL